jgi:hypothetical protein
MVVVVVDRRHLSFCVERSLALDNADKDESEFSAPLSVMWAEFAVFLYSPYQAYLNSKQTILTTAFHTSSHSQTSSRLTVTNREIVKCNLGNAGIARASLPLRSYRFWEREHECKRRIKQSEHRSIGQKYHRQHNFHLRPYQYPCSKLRLHICHPTSDIYQSESGQSTAIICSQSTTWLIPLSIISSNATCPTDGSPLHLQRHHWPRKIGLQSARHGTTRCDGHLLNPNTDVFAEVGESVAPVVGGVGTKRANLVAAQIGSVNGEDAIDLGRVGEWVDDVVSNDSHVFERQVQRLRGVPHAMGTVGSVVAVDSVGGQRRHGCWSHGELIWWWWWFWG